MSKKLELMENLRWSKISFSWKEKKYNDLESTCELSDWKSIVLEGGGEIGWPKYSNWLLGKFLSKSGKDGMELMNVYKSFSWK